ncbi:unnamed protein product [Lepeophtheirus salmonis]|uniref:(salmon louse) hypothetical protein n=1 Tax=Lepeophtheirus salmonis TaxID=72036 RepID=A0A7R8D544_LEPSM|nr:unnamed protein product [Lepeophtheirus salmonis]CAF3031321.1 unnamed protein product [Lepeophtheirus salmonis]
MSGTLFTLVMESVFHETDAPYEIGLSGTAINRMMYVDDTVLIFKHIKGIQGYLESFEISAAKVGISLSSYKSGMLSTIEGNKKGLMYVDSSHMLTSSDANIANMKLNDFYRCFGKSTLVLGNKERI